MKLLFPLPNGAELNLLDEGPNGMEYICWFVVSSKLLYPNCLKYTSKKQTISGVKLSPMKSETKRTFLPDKLALLMKNSSK